MSWRKRDGTRVRERKSASMKRQVECPCLCHDVSGGPLHPGQLCKCKNDK